jgi:hypothetical protein
VRAGAAESLSTLKISPERGAPALTQALLGAPEDVEAVLLEALETYGKDGIEPILARLIRRPEQVIPTIGRAARHMPKIFVKPLVVRLTTGGNLISRENAAAVLAVMGRDADAAEDGLVDALAEREVLFRAKVIRALGRVSRSPKKIEEVLIDIGKNDGRPGIKVAISDALIYLHQD